MPSQPRQPKGTTKGGQFAESPHAEAVNTLDTRERMPLEDYDIVGFTRKVYSPVPDVHQPGGTCWHCGAAISNCVQLRHRETGEVIDVGPDCAERAGLDRDQVRSLMKEKYAQERSAAREAAAAARRQAKAEAEAAAVTEHGEHGSEDRYNSGCRCHRCRQGAPHGTFDRYNARGCLCVDCVAAVLASDDDWSIDDSTVLIDVDTGERLNARCVSTRYGLRWAVDRYDDDGNQMDTDWYPVEPARRSTLAKKGVVEVPARALVRTGRSARLGDYYRIEGGILSVSDTDAWGEPVPAGTYLGPDRERDIVDTDG